MVMNHTGGFPFEIPTKSKKGWNRLSLRDTAREAAALPLRFEPGTKANYSNTGIDIGAAIVEVMKCTPKVGHNERGAYYAKKGKIL